MKAIKLGYLFAALCAAAAIGYSPAAALADVSAQETKCYDCTVEPDGTMHCEYCVIEPE